MKMRLHMILGVALAAFATASAAEELVRIGLAAPLTGPQAHLGQDIANGARLATEEINATQPKLGGQPVRFELVVEDDQADPRTATVVAQKFVDSGVKGVIGHLNSGASIPASRVYNDGRVPQISPCSTAVAYTHQGFDTTFRLMANDAQQGAALGEYAAKIGKRVAVVDDRTAYGQGLADEVVKALKARGVEPIAHEFTTDKSTDFTAILTSIKGKKPDVIVYCGMDAQGAPMARQMRTLGIKALFLGGDGIQTAEFIKLAGTATENAVGSSPGLPLEKMPGGADFEKRFAAKYGKIQLYAPFAYDSVRVMVDAMRRAGSADPEKYRAELAKTDTKGVVGHIAFDAMGDLKDGAVTLYQVKEGKWSAVETLGGSSR